MFKKGDVVIIKGLDELLKQGLLKKAENMPNVYHNEDLSYVVFDDFPYFGSETIIEDIDKKDKDIPYFLSVGIWVPGFMIVPKVEPEDEPKDKPIEEVKNVDKPKNEEKPKVYINKFNNKPFGKLFCKLITLDEKIAEFSSTAFSKLKKHELQYIAKLLQDHGAEYIDYNKATQRELATYCYLQTLNL